MSDDQGRRAIAPDGAARTDSGAGARAGAYGHVLLQSILDGSASVFTLKNRRGEYLLVNRRAEELLGVSPGKALGKTLATFMPEAAYESEAAERRVWETGEPGRTEQAVRVLGEQRKFQSELFPLRDGDGEMYAICTIATDVTDHRTLAEEARARGVQQDAVAALGSRLTGEIDLERFLLEVVSTVADILHVDDAMVLELRPGGAELRLRAAVGVADGLDGATTVPVDSATESGYALQTGEPVVVEDFERETRFEPSPLLGEQRVSSGASVVIRGEQDAFGVLSAYSRQEHRFTTDEVHFMQALATIVAAAISRARSVELERQLQQTRRLESLGQLAGGIAHDFNNLLSVILNYSMFLSDGLAEHDESLREDAEEITKAARRAADLTRQLLVFSHQELAPPEVIDVNSKVGEAENLLRRTLGEDVELTTYLEPGTWPIRAGSGQVEQILVNLAVNSRDAMRDGGRLSLETKNVELEQPMMTTTGELPHGRYVRLTVADSGTGMSQEVMAQAFDPFFTTKAKGEGTGLGLATIYGIAQEHGGQIQVYSEPGHGTAIKVYMPAVPDETVTVPKDSHPPAPARGETILVVEDEDAVRELTRRILVEAGYNVLAANGGHQARISCDQYQGTIDLLLTDVVMPGMSGAQLVEQIHTLRPTVKVLYMSGYTGDTIARPGLIDHGVALVEKPFGATSLLHHVREALGD